jgi:hypothetical protein
MNRAERRAADPASYKQKTPILAAMLKRGAELAASGEPFPERPRGMHRKTYDRLKARALNLKMDLPPKLRGRAVDYKNLIYYLP